MPQLPAQIWLLALGRLLSQVGTGFTLFYAPIFFVNQVGLSATQVGIGLGCEALSGVLGRLLSGSFVDMPVWGRRRTLLLATGVSAIAAFALAIAYNFPTFVLGTLLMGLGVGLYWPATETLVADLTTPEQRHEAYAITRLADTVGLGVGTLLAGILINRTGALRSLFIIDGLSFLIFFGVIYVAIAETTQVRREQTALAGWLTALRDRRLLVYSGVNMLFTTYIAQLQSTVPLYFSNFIRTETGLGFAPAVISALFAGHLLLSVGAQLPIARALTPWRQPRALMIAALLWSIGFALLGLTSLAPPLSLSIAGLAMASFSLGTVAYLPIATALVVDLAPPSLRGIYLGVNAQAWAIGYFIGPTLGGWALDQSRSIVDGYWGWLAFSVIVALGILAKLDQMMPSVK
jgi:MFS family permease